MPDLGSSLSSVLQVPGLQELLNSAITQERQRAPLRTAVSQQAANMLPNSAFGAAGRPNMSTIPAASYGAGSGASGGGTDWTKILSMLGAGIAGGGALAKLLGGNNSGGGGNLAAIANGLKKLFGHGGSPSANGNNGSPLGLNFGPFADNPYPDWLDTGAISPTDRSPMPGVSTDYNFNNDPNLGQGGTDDAGGYYGGGGEYNPPEPSAEWGG